eukprot:INCI7242.3.p1 GENE.INCI7242.3~~INCI7242.3.p1  ORF type:complete len:293 (+),score=23.71 INCI7242.3:355-1233(+)
MHKWTSTTVAVVLRRQTVRNAIFTCTREPRPVAHAPDISFLVVKPWIGGMMVATMFVLAIDAPNWYCGSVVAIGTLVASYFTFTMVVFWLGDATKEQGPPAPAMIQAFFVFPVIWRLFFNAMLMLLRIYVGSSLLVQGAVVAGSGSAALLAVAVAERLFCGRLRTSFIVFATLPSILTLLYYGGPHFVLHPPIDDAPGMYYILSFGSVVAGIAIQAAIWVICLVGFGFIFRRVQYLLPELRRAEQQSRPPHRQSGYDSRRARRRTFADPVPTDQQIHQLIPEADIPNSIAMA